ncbi:protein of unknown function [Maridesulfovibrio hydrothermalis AM13 = DSM 14728]|uniref:Uncharacterized protein n=1 Tax=Maridesulfovibrio hydrothermalis AM13 = DSM 14728 TaxID=1121451 RepID=L0RBV8_9BACT|nr:protein of unknown function [Maridesulfovibrio hydrothermalis AM13 = DSM 14728]
MAISIIDRHVWPSGGSVGGLPLVIILLLCILNVPYIACSVLPGRREKTLLLFVGRLRLR